MIPELLFFTLFACAISYGMGMEKGYRDAKQGKVYLDDDEGEM